MIENQGIHINLTSDANSFASEMQRASQELFELRNEVHGLKNDEGVLRSTISGLTKEIEKKKNSLTEAKNKLEQYESAEKGTSKEAEKLKEKIKALENEISKSSDKLKTNESRLASNGEKQSELAGRILKSSKYVEDLTADFMKNTDSVRQNENANKNLSQTMKNGALALKGVVLGYAGRTLYEALIGGNAEFEQSITNFEVLLQSAEKAEKMINDLDKFGADTPFELEDLTGATEQLLAFGTAEEDVMLRLQQLGDLSKGNAQILERITLAYGKMQAKGKVSLEELNMLTEAGVPILKELSEQLGVTTDELFKKISAGEINVEHINEAFKSLTSEGGQFFGMMEKQSQTLNGMLSTFSDNVNIALRDMGEGAFETVKQEFSDILSELQRMNDDGSLKVFAQNVGSYIAVAVNGIVGFINILYQLRGVLTQIATAAILYKTMQKGAAITQSAVKTIQAYTSVIKIMNAAHSQGISIKTLFQAALGKEKSIIETLTAAGYKDITVKKGIVTATNAATGATETFKIASMGLNAVLGITSTVISVVAMACMSYKQKQDEARRATEEAAKAADEERESLQGLINEYKELRTSGDWDNSARERAKEIQEEISKLVGEEVEGLDDVNGKLEDKIDILNEATYQKAYEDTDKYADDTKAKGEMLWDKIYWNGRAINFSVSNEEDLKMFENAGFDVLYETGEVSHSFYNSPDGMGEFLELYPKLIKIKDDLANSNKRETETYENLSKVINEYSAEYEAFVSAIDAEMKNEATKEISEYLMKNDINDIDAFKSYIDGIKNSTEYSEQYKQVLIDIANGAFPQFSGAMQETGAGIDAQGGSVSDLIQNFDKLSDNLSVLNNAQNEFNKTGKLSVNSIAEIKDKFSGLGESVDGYIERLVEANGNGAEMKKIMSEMTEEMIIETLGAENLTQANVDLIAEELKRIGVLNATEAAQYLVNKSSQTLSEAIDDNARMLLNEKIQAGATREELEKYAEELGITTDVLNALINAHEVFNDTGIDVDDKIDALERLSLAAGYTAENLFGVTTAAGLSEAANWAYIEAIQMGKSEEEAQAARDEYINDFYNKYKDKTKTEKPQTNFNFLYSGQTNNDPNANKDPNKGETPFDKEYKKHQHLRNMEQETDEDYFNWLDGAYKDALANGQLTTEEAWKHEEEVYKGRKKIEEERIAEEEKNQKEQEKNQKEQEKNQKEEAEDRYRRFQNRISNSKNWLEEQIKDGNFDAVYEGWDRITQYTDTFYATEKEKLKEALDNGIITVEESNKQLENLTANYGEDQKEIREGRKKSIDDDFKQYVERANKYISERNFYGDWAEWGDTEQQAIARMFSNFDEYRAKGVSSDIWISAYSEISKEIYQSEKERLISSIEEEKEILQKKYEEELDMKKTAAEKEIEVAKEKADAEIEAVNKRADAEIEKIDELIRKRREAQEDEDYNLRMQRLQLQLEYEMDEDNQKALRKEIKKLQEEIADKEFEREMERKKEEIEDKRNEAIEFINKRLNNQKVVSERKIKLAQNSYDEKMSDESLTEILLEKFNYDGFQAIAESMGIDFQDGILRGLQGILSAFDESMFKGNVENYDYSQNSKVYKMYNSFSGAHSSSDMMSSLKRLLDKLELEANC